MTGMAFVLNLDHWDFEFVSDLGFGIWDLFRILISWVPVPFFPTLPLPMARMILIWTG